MNLTLPSPAPCCLPGPRLRPHRPRLILIEPLEQRIAPAVATFTGATSDDWNVATNWDIGRVPGLLPTDATDLDVVINLAGTHTVSVNGTFDVKSLTMAGDDRISVSGFGTLTLQTTSSFAAGFDIAGGTLNAVLGLSVSGPTAHTNGTVTGEVTNHGTWGWSGGPLGGHFTNANDGIVNMTGVGNKRLQGGVFDNAGMLNVSGSNTDVHANGIYNNLAGGVVNITTDNSVFGTDGSGNFNNAGTVQKTAGAGETYFGNTRFNNAATGVVSVTSGSLVIGAGGTSTGGDFSAALGSQLFFRGNQTWMGPFTGSGMGVVQVNNSHISPGIGGFTLNFSGAGIEFGSAAFIDGGSVLNTGLIKVVSNFQSFRLHGATVVNSGTIVVVPGAGTEMYENSIITNQAGGLYHIQSDGGVIGGDGTGTLNNFGTIQRSIGAGTASIAAKLNNQPNGIIDVDSGELRFVNGGVSTGATFDIASSAQLTFSNTAPTWSGSFTGSGAGSVVWSGPINPGAAGLTLNFPAGLFKWGGNGFGGANTLGAGTVTNLGFITLTGGGGSAQISGTTFLNAGTITESDANVNFNISGGSFTNLPTGVFDIQRDGVAIGGNGAGNFINVGEVRKSGGVGEARVQVPFDNGADGVVNVTSGSLAIVSGGTSMGGHFNAGAGSSIIFRTSPQTWSGTFTGSGPGTVQFHAGRVNVGSVGLTLDFPADVFQLGGNGAGGPNVIAGGTVNNTGFITLAGPGGAAFFENATLNNSGTIIANDDDVSLNLTSSNFNNLATGVFDIQRDGVVINGNGAGLINNAGLFKKTAAFEVTFLTSFIQEAFNNTGAVEARTGTLNFSNVSNLSSGTLTGGAWRVIDTDVALPNTQLVFPQNITTNAGTITLDGTTAQIPQLGLLAANNGALELRGGKDLTRNGAFANNGTLSIGPASNFNVTDAFTAGASSRVEFLLGGNPASGNFGTLNVGGVAALAGTAAFTLADGFGPANGQSFTLATFGSSDGDFTAFEGLTLQRTDIFEPTLSETSLVLEAVGDVGDLDVTAVNAPLNGISGQDVTVTWTVMNNGPLATFTTTWTDSVYLSLDDQFDASDKLIGRVEHDNGTPLGAGGSYNGMLTAPLPGVVPGEYKVFVVTDSRGEEPDRDRSNNADVSSVITTDMTALTPGAATMGTIGEGEDLWFRVTLPFGQTPHFSATYGAAGTAEFYLRQFDTPDRATFDRLEFSPGAAGVDFTQFNGTAGTYYVLLHGREAAGAGQSFTITAEGLPFGISDLDGARGANVGSVTTTIHGSLFTPQTIFTLVPTSGPAIPASTLTYVDSSTVWATFNLTGAAVGAYDVVANSPGGSDTLDDGFNVVTGVPGKFSYSLSAPQYIRAPFRGAIVTLTYENTGDTDIGAPLVLISSENATFFPPTFSGGKDNFFELFPANPDGPAGVLPPGAKGIVQIPFIPQDLNAHALTPITASVMNAAGITIDWDLLKDDLQPLGVPDDAYEQIFANFKAQVGGNYATYSAALAADATRLSLLGTRTFDPGVFVSFEMQEAGDFGQLTDRYTFGLFGRGPISAFEIEAIPDAAGNVAIQLGGDVRNFAKLANGTFAAMPGDNATLTKDGGGLFHLVEGNGLETIFRADGKFLSNTDRDGKSLTAAYNGIGQIVSLTTSDDDPLTTDQVATFTLDGNGKIATKTDTLGRVTTYTYDAAGQHLLSSVNAAGTTQYTYATTPGAEHALASITHPDGTHTFFQYDARGRLSEQTRDGGAEQLTYTYDNAGGVTVTDALGNATRLLRDATGNVARAIDPLGGFTAATFDLLGNLTGTSNRAGASATIENGANGLLMDFSGSTAGNVASADLEGVVDGLQSFTHGGGGTTSYLYDAAGNVTSIVRPDGSILGFRYDTSGNITQAINASSEVTVMNYDAQGNLVGKVFPDGSTVTYSYDAHRNLTGVTDGSGTIVYQYDAADRVTKVTYPGGLFVSFTYDAGGRRASIADQDGIGTKYSYDAVGRLSAITDQSDNAVAAYTYDAAGRLATETQANGTTTEYTRDALGRVIGIAEKLGGLTQTSIIYTYDSGGRIATSIDAAGTTTYSYDPTGQLVQVALPGGRTISYSYDAQGNRTAVNDSASGVENYASNEVDEITSAGTATFTYDANGRLSTKTESGVTTIYRYDVRGRLALQFSPTESTAYEYDALGNLRATTNAAGERTTYLVDPTGLGNVVAEYDAAGDLIAHYRRGADLESREDGGGTQAFYHFDSIGNTTKLTGAAGAELNSYRYLPFGEKLVASETVENPFTFNGRDGVQDLDDGFYFMRARSYDPGLGRFIEIDPLGILGADTNFYRYANNDPINANDPSGLTAPVLGGIASAITTILPPLPGGIAFPFSGLGAGAAGTTGLSLGGFTSSAATQSAGFLTADGIATTSAIEWLTPYAPAVGGGVAEATVGSGLLTAAGETAAFFGPPALLAAAIAGPILAVDAIKARENAYARVDDPFSPEAGYDNPNFRPRDIMDSPKVREVIEENNFDPDDREDVNIAVRAVNDLTREQQYERDWQDWLTNGMQGEEPKPPTLPKVVSELIYSGDPNNIYGPSGFGADAIADNPDTQPTRFEGFVQPTGDFAYKIVFENMPTASASAQFVEVTQALDANLDPATLRFTSFGWGDVRVEVPADHPAGADFFRREDVRDIYGIFVDVAATIDTVTGDVRVTFTAVDPVTGDLPLDALAGFLPPNVTPPEGDGFINYTVKPDAGLTDGTEIKAKARIVFDTNPFIDTPEITNQTDATAPSSVITAFASPTTYRPVFKVQWTGADPGMGSGLAYYDVYFRDNGGPQQLAFNRTTETSGRFTGEVGHTYEFFVTATDNVGNIEALAPADATIEVVAPPLLTAPGNKITLFDSDGDKYTLKLTGPGTLKYLTLDPDGAGPLDGSLDFLVAESTTTKSNLSVTVVRAKDGPDLDKLPDGDGIVTIGDVQIAGSLGRFMAKASDLNVTGFLASGTTKAITVRDLLRPDPIAADPLIKLGGTNVDKTTITARNLASGFEIETPGILSSIKATDIDDGTITAAALSKLNTTAGGMDADLAIAGAVGPVTIKGGGANAGNWTGTAFGNIGVTGGALDVDIDTAGAIAKITVKGGGITGQLTARSFGVVSLTDGNLSGLLVSTTPVATLAKTAALKSLTITGGDLAGDVRLLGNFGALSVKAGKTGVGGNITDATFSAAKFGNVTVAKDVTNAMLLAGADLGTDFAPGGMSTALDTFAAGSMGTVKIGGMATGAIIGAGLSTTDSILGNGDDEILGGAASSIAGLTITGVASGGSSISAGLFKGKPKIDGIVATPVAIPGGFRMP